MTDIKELNSSRLHCPEDENPVFISKILEKFENDSVDNSESIEPELVEESKESCVVLNKGIKSSNILSKRD
tara:strand:- start:143 stop:355 length:213 start_codon:yes stop_codon:yes gene_type:complete